MLINMETKLNLWLLVDFLPLLSPPPLSLSSVLRSVSPRFLLCFWESWDFSFSLFGSAALTFSRFYFSENVSITHIFKDDTDIWNEDLQTSGICRPIHQILLPFCWFIFGLLSWLADCLMKLIYKTYNDMKERRGEVRGRSACYRWRWRAAEWRSRKVEEIIWVKNSLTESHLCLAPDPNQDVSPQTEPQLQIKASSKWLNVKMGFIWNVF